MENVTLPPSGPSVPSVPNNNDPPPTSGTSPPAAPDTIAVSGTSTYIFSSTSQTNRISLGDFFHSVIHASDQKGLQDLLDALTDTQNQTALWEYASERALSTQAVIQDAIQYTGLQDQLDALDLSGQKTTTDNAVDAFNSDVGVNTHPEGEYQSLVDAINSDVTAYNNNMTQANYNKYVTDSNAYHDFRNGQGKTDTDQANAGISDWNNLAAQANAIIAQLNNLRVNTFGFPPLPLAPTISGTATNLQDFTPESQPANNGNLSSFNPTFSSQVDVSAVHSYTPPSPEDLNTEFINPLLAVFAQFKAQNARQTQSLDNSIANVTDTVPVFPTQTVLGGVGSVQMTTTPGATSGLSSPFLERELSREAFESFYNEYGVPQGSPLVDQIGALISNYSSLNALTGAGPAQSILAGASLTGSNAGQAIGVAVALGTLQQTTDLIQSGQITAAVTQLVNQNNLNLSDANKTALINSLVQEIGDTLLRQATTQVATQLNLPGLLPQILAQVANANGENFIAEQNALFLESSLVDQLVANTGLTAAQAEQVVNDAFTAHQTQIQADIQNSINASSADQIALQSQNTQNDIVNFILDQVQKTNLQNAAAEAQIRQSVSVAQANLSQEITNSALQQQGIAFQDSVRTQLIDEGLNATRASTIASQITFSSSQNDVAQALVQQDQNLSQEQATQIANTAITAAQNQSNSGTYNPLGSFLMQQVGSSTNLSAAFKLQVQNILSPVVGARQALEVATNYGNLFFTSPNSVVSTEIANDKNLRSLERFNASSRRLEEYMDATQAYRDPTSVDSSPQRLGATLLLAGNLSDLGTLTGQPRAGGPRLMGSGIAPPTDLAG